MKELQIYKLRSTKRPINRPDIDLDLPENDVPWLEIAKIQEGKQSAKKYKPIKMTVKDRNFANWHMYMSGGSFPFISEAFAEIIREHMKPCFELLDAFINDKRYYLLRAIDVIDCLNLNKSEVSWLDKKDKVVDQIDRYAFNYKKISDPLFFRVANPKYYLFATEAIKAKVISQKLKGVYFYATDGSNKIEP